MSRRFRQYQAAFVAGELSDTLHGRSDLEAYYLGAKSLTNTIGLAQGDVKVRPGMEHVAALLGDGRLAAFDLTDAGQFIVVFTAAKIQVYDDSDGSQVADITGPYSASEVHELSWVNVNDTLLIAHPEHPLKALVRGSPWAIGDYAFEEPPQYRYAGRSVTLTPGAATGTGVSLVASASLFAAGHVGTKWLIDGKRVTIASVSDDQNATIDITDTLSGVGAETEWSEEAASSVRGYYRTVAYTTSRLFLGGTRDAPAQLWASRSGAPYDHFEGPSLEDDDPFSLPTNEGEAKPIYHLVPGTAGLEVLTGAGEGLVPFDENAPLTPSTAFHKRQTRYGSSRTVKPVQLDAQTIFRQSAGGALREFVYSDIEQAYSAVPLTVRATHLVTAPRALAVLPGGWGTQTDFVVVANDDGTAACMSSQRSENVAAWRGWTSTRKWRDLATVNQRMYALTSDAGGSNFYLERFDEAARFDAQKSYSGAATDTFTGATHLASTTAQVFADLYDRDDVSVNGSGEFTTPDEYAALDVGYAFQPVVALLAPESPRQSLSGRPRRPVRAYVTYKGTAGLRVNGIAVPDQAFDDAIDEPPSESDGVARVFLRGWNRSNASQVSLTREGSRGWRIVAVAVDYAVTP